MFLLPSPLTPCNEQRYDSFVKRDTVAPCMLRLRFTLSAKYMNERKEEKKRLGDL